MFDNSRGFCVNQQQCSMPALYAEHRLQLQRDFLTVVFSVSAFMHNGSIIPGQGGPNMMQQPGMQQQQQPVPAAAPQPAATKSGLMGGLFGGMSKLTGAAATTAPSQQPIHIEKASWTLLRSSTPHIPCKLVGPRASLPAHF